MELFIILNGCLNGLNVCMGTCVCPCMCLDNKGIVQKTNNDVFIFIFYLHIRFLLQMLFLEAQNKVYDFKLLITIFFVLTF